MDSLRYRINYAIKSDNGLYFRKFDGNAFQFTHFIEQAMMWHEDKEPTELLEMKILGQYVLPDCEMIKVKTEEYREIESLTHQHEDKGE